MNNAFETDPTRFTQHITEIWKTKLQHFPSQPCFIE